MFTNRTMAALFTIAVASSSLLVSSGLVGSVFAVMEKVTTYSMVPIISVGQHKSSSSMPQSANDVGGGDSSDNTYPAVLRKDESSLPMLQSANPDSDSDWTTADTNAVPAKYLKSLSKCQSGAAADGDLTAAEVMDCYHQVF
jgi:hypothetical protein